MALEILFLLALIVLGAKSVAEALLCNDDDSSDRLFEANRLDSRPVNCSPEELLMLFDETSFFGI